MHFLDEGPSNNPTSVNQFFPVFKKYGIGDEILIFGTQYGTPEDDDAEGKEISRNIVIQFLLNTPYVPTGRILEIKKGTKIEWAVTDDEFRGITLVCALAKEVEESLVAA